MKKKEEPPVEIGYPKNDHPPYAQPHQPQPLPVYSRPEKIHDENDGITEDTPKEERDARWLFNIIKEKRDKVIQKEAREGNTKRRSAAWTLLE